MTSKKNLLPTAASAIPAAIFKVCSADGYLLDFLDSSLIHRKSLLDKAQTNEVRGAGQFAACAMVIR